MSPRTSTTPPRTARRRAVLAVCLLAMMLGGLLLVAAAFRPPRAAPEPERTFDLRTSASTPQSTAGRAPTGGREPGSSSSSSPSAEDTSVVHARVADPVRLRITGLGVDAEVRPEPVTEGGELVVPGDPRVVGSWHGDGARATSAGTLVLAGHVDSDGDLGALHPLSGVGPGAVVELVDAGGRVESWRVDALEVRAKDALPQFPGDGPRRLALITCGGPVVDTGHGHSYRDNVIAWASPVG